MVFALKLLTGTKESDVISFSSDQFYSTNYREMWARFHYFSGESNHFFSGSIEQLLGGKSMEKRFHEGTHSLHKYKRETEVLPCALKRRTMFCHCICVVFDSWACHELSYYESIIGGL